MTVRRPSSVAVVGGGILGLAVARQLQLSQPGVAVTVFEKEDRVAAHQSGHNSGVVHAGLYYQPRSLKAQLCTRGARLLREFCQRHEIACPELGKLVIATDERQLPALADIESRAARNGVRGIRRVTPVEMADIEPHATGVAAIHSPHTAVVDYVAVCAALADEILRGGGHLQLRSTVIDLARRGDRVDVVTEPGPQAFDQAIVCAGLHSDRLARAGRGPSDLRIIPFRGEYFALRAPARDRVRGLIYPVPDPSYPFLGVHLTRDVHGGVHAGPNAVLALALEGYRRRDVDPREVAHIATWPGTWRLAAKHWRQGLHEVRGSISRRSYLARIQAYVPGISLDDLEPAPAGVRAQALDRTGRLVDDFVLQDAGLVFLVRNAPSPGATSSLAIAEHIVARASGAA